MRPKTYKEAIDGFTLLSPVVVGFVELIYEGIEASGHVVTNDIIASMTDDEPIRMMFARLLANGVRTRADFKRENLVAIGWALMFLDK